MNRAEARLRFVGWVVLLLLLAGWMRFQSQSGQALKTDLFTLLPNFEDSADLREASDYFSKQGSTGIFLLITAQDAKLRELAAAELEQRMQKSGFFLRVQGRISEQGFKQAQQIYFHYREGLLDIHSRNLLQAGADEQFIQSRIAQIYSPTSFGMLAELARDPLLLQPNFLMSLAQAQGSVRLRGDWRVIESDQKEWILLNAQIQSSGLEELKFVQEYLDQLYREILQKFPELELASSELFRFSVEGSRAVRADVELVGSISLCGIFLLLLYFFPSKYYLLGLILSLLSGLIFAICGVLFFKGEIHILTFGFGVSLLGVCIDYILHCSADFAYSEHSARQSLRRVLPGISLGLITSLIAYLSLAASSLVVLEQLAIFSACGLIGSYLSVLICFPCMPAVKPGQVKREKVLKLFSQALPARFVPGHGRALTLLALAVLLSVPGLLRLHMNDDVRLFQALPEHLLKEQIRFREIFPEAGEGMFMLINADSYETLLQKSEELGAQLATLKDSGRLRSYRLISDFLPSCKSQQLSFTLLKELLKRNRDKLETYVENIGLAKVSLDQFSQRLSEPYKCLEVEEWLKAQSGFSAEDLLYQHNDSGVSTLITLSGVVAPQELQQLTAISGVSFVNRLAQLSNYFKSLRQEAAKLIVLAYAVIFLLLLARYGRRRGIRIFLAPCLAALFALALLGMAGLPFNIFSILGLILVLGIGIDYSIFLAEAGLHGQSAWLAICLSALTTVLTFGLLSLSSTAALASFGCIVSIGVCFSALLSPIAWEHK